MEQIMRRFLWNKVGHGNYYAQIGWKTICLPKKHGGLGIKHFTHWNKAFLLKLLWISCQKQDRPSVHLVWAKDKLFDDIGIQNGKGANTSFWYDKWLPMGPLDQFFNIEQNIITWKPPAKPTFEINVEAFHNEDRTMAMGAAIVRDSEFQWFIGITRRIVFPCMLEILLITLKEALIQAWGYHIDNLEIDLEKQLITELQAGPEGCRSYLKTVTKDIRDLLDRKWHITLNYAHRAVNLTASVLAILNQHHKEAIIVHFVPPNSLEPALELDSETFKMAERRLAHDAANRDMEEGEPSNA
ncbi:hypothetical protein Cgig2_005087 [Carnegiea gigantea]|uniref:RNase H type-1 domain-containing protein n=1 Tax=Carnegiea gigantea TaxID=171969 RepID=A0A9Q1L1N2_9CARY|nr:hypothetical protein Cgig2_005087 [Carnegiea gigantea]